MFSKDLLSLPTDVVEHIFKRTPIYDLINFSLSSDVANEAVSQFNYLKTPRLEVTVKRQNDYDFFVEMSVSDSSGVWTIEMKDRKRPRIMERIGDFSVVIQKSTSSENLTINTVDILKTTSSLVHHIEEIFKSIDLTITFDSVDINREIAQWKLISEAKKIKMIDSSVHYHSNFQKLLNPEQELVLDGGRVVLNEKLSFKSIEINLNCLRFHVFNAEHLIFHDWDHSEDEAFKYIDMWKNGELERFKSFQFVNGYPQWMYYGFGATEWTEGERFYETEKGEKIDCSQGIDWIRGDGRVGTLVLTEINEDQMERRTARFLVWP
uniref:F-box domain-containing protein n=1 Tax=Caenorhabditis tropicalis TaxID=1561998 RepID=A0A1I7T6G6_9PELO